MAKKQSSEAAVESGLGYLFGGKFNPKANHTKRNRFSKVRIVILILSWWLEMTV